VLGGMVEDLEAARQKSAEEVIEPPKGERYIWGNLSSLLAIISDVYHNSNRLTRKQKEMDYTYLDELFDDWEEKNRDGETSALYKGLMHGVIKFEFENMSKYELIVMFRDGSDTSQIFIDHKVSLNLNILLLSFLVLLQGTLIVEMKTGSAVPVAVQVDSTYNASWVLYKLDENICGVGNTDKDYYLESMRIKSEMTRNITSA
ncbi:hypothetical protein MKW94_003830, partial [Papaver nudicaule]|nr:hypothetical protein [Papaver nudicaule]